MEKKSPFTLIGNNLSLMRNDVLIFEHINFELSQGELLYIKGENGAGKTSLLKMIIGLQKDFTGKINVNQETIHTLQEIYRAMVLHIGHQVAIKKNLTVYENLLFYLKLSNTQRKNNLDEIILSELIHLKLAALFDVTCAQLSAGQQRRVALTRLFISNLLNHHKIWVLDEPFVSLDKSGCDSLQQLIENFILKGNAVILTSHQELNFSVPTKILELPEGQFYRV